MLIHFIAHSLRPLVIKKHEISFKKIYYEEKSENSKGNGKDLLSRILQSSTDEQDKRYKCEEISINKNFHQQTKIDCCMVLK
jgi:hypothetical protein